MTRKERRKMIGVVKKNLNFRKSPEKKTDNIIKILPKDQNVNVKEDLGEWLKVTVGNKSGYVMAEHIAFAPEAPEEPEQPGTPEGKATEQGGDNIQATVIGKDQAAGEIDEDGNYLIDGKIVGKVEGDNIMITDPDIIAETLAEIEKEKAAGSDE